MRHLISVLVLKFLGFKVSFEKVDTLVQETATELIKMAGIKQPITLVGTGSRGKLAFAFRNTIAIHPAICLFSKLQLNFIIAHELGHIALDHSTIDIDGIMPHDQEIDADDFAIDLLLRKGWTRQEIFYGLGSLLLDAPETSTHPSGVIRLARIRNKNEAQ